MSDIIITTTNSVKGYKIEKYLGVVNANFVAGTDFVVDFLAKFSDFFGGNSIVYKSEMDELYDKAKRSIEAEVLKLGGNAVLGYSVDFDEISGKGKSMFMISASGTAVKLTQDCKEKGLETFEPRREYYQKLYDLKRFFESNVITEKQYNIEKRHLELCYEDEINMQLLSIQSTNNMQLMERNALKEVREAKEKRLKEMNELLEQQRIKEEEIQARRDEERKKQQESLKSIKQAQDEFLANVDIIYAKVKLLIDFQIPNIDSILNMLTLNDVNKVSYDASLIDSTEKVAYTIGSFIKKKSNCRGLQVLYGFGW